MAQTGGSTAEAMAPPDGDALVSVSESMYAVCRQHPSTIGQLMHMSSLACRKPAGTLMVAALYLDASTSDKAPRDTPCLQ